MNGDIGSMLWMYIVAVALLMMCGAYCLLVTRNLIRTIIGIELLVKAVTLLVIIAGYVTGKLALAQSMVITITVIEVVITVIAGGIAIRVFKYTGGLDIRKIQNLKG